MTASAEEAATTRVAFTDARGVAELRALRTSARYEVVVPLAGFQTTRQGGVLVRAGQTASVLPIASLRAILDFRRPQDVAVADGTVETQRARVLAAVKALRCAPPPLRGAEGLDGGSAHARPDCLLHDGASIPAPTCCRRRAVQINAVSGAC